MSHKRVQFALALAILLLPVVWGLWPAAAQEESGSQSEAVGRSQAGAEIPIAEGVTAGFQVGELLVKFRPGVSASAVEASPAPYGATRLRTLYGTDTQVWQVPEGQEWATARLLKADPIVQYAEPNFIAHAFATPNDPYFNNQWAHALVESEAAWNFSTGSGGVTIAVLDTGIDGTHPDLAGKIAPGFDAVDGDSNPQDENGHGTHVAGIAAAATNNGTGVAGMDWQARIMPVRVLNDQGSGTYGDIIEGINFAYQNGADVLNLSLGGTASSSLLQAAINDAYAAGSLVVAAMGNENSWVPQYPAASANVMAVAATGPSDSRASYSNYGSHCDIAAPGGEAPYDPYGIFSTMPTYDVYMTYEGFATWYDYVSGTSMAAPYVAGLAALVRSADSTLTPDEVQALIQNTADDKGSAGWDQYYGHGRINALAALQAASPPVVPAAPTLLSINNDAGLPSFTVSWTTVADATGYTLEEDDNASFSTPTVRYSGVNLQFLVTAPAGGIWHYRVRAFNSAGDGPWSNSVSTTVRPGAPVLNTISNPTNDDEYWVTWSAPSGAAGYRLQEDDNSAFSSPLVRYEGLDKQYRVTGQPGGTWYYRALAYNTAGDGAWSVTRSTTVYSGSLSRPILYSIDNSDGDGQYLVNWSSVSGATSYTLEESLGPYFDDPMTYYPGPATQFNVSGKSGGTWYYRVRALGSGGSSPWSDAQSANVTAWVYLPFVVDNFSGVAPGSGIQNGGFESGATAWTQWSSNGRSLIREVASLPADRPPHGGVWAAWLGETDDNIDYIQQQVTVPAGTPSLSFWHWIDSTDQCPVVECTYDCAKVLFDGVVVDQYNLCFTNNTGGWVQYTVSLSAYAGRSGWLQIRVDTDLLLLSSLYIDDISFVQP